MSLCKQAGRICQVLRMTECIGEQEVHEQGKLRLTLNVPLLFNVALDSNAGISQDDISFGLDMVTIQPLLRNND